MWLGGGAANAHVGMAKTLSVMRSKHMCDICVSLSKLQSTNLPNSQDEDRNSCSSAGQPLALLRCCFASACLPCCSWRYASSAASRCP